MNIVDSSGWLAYFADEPSAKHFKRNRYYVPGYARICSNKVITRQEEKQRYFLTLVQSIKKRAMFFSD
jgi:hypothetical protein